jgi:glycogen debranching enzyme
VIEHDDDDDRYPIVATFSLTDHVTRVLKHDETFAVFDAHGDIRQHGAREQGIYHEGTRFLSKLRMRLGRADPLLLSSMVRDNNALLAVDLTSPDQYQGDELAIEYGTLHILRTKFLWRGVCYEKLEISNYSRRRLNAELRLSYEADYLDVFEVRGSRRPARGERLPPEIGPASVVLGYRGLDRVVRRTRFEFAPPPVRCSEKLAVFAIELEAKQSKELYVSIACEVGDTARAVVSAFENAQVLAQDRTEHALPNGAELHTSNEHFDEWLARSVADLRMMVSATPHGPYPYAGVPWFSAPFGRDGIITALESLWLVPDLAAGVLRFLASMQAEEEDPDLDAEPGKILHELRLGEMAALGEIPFGRYYGSVDSTPLFVLLASQYFQSTGDRALVHEIWPNVERALEWMDRHGDHDGDGFIEYGRRSKDGLVQQGWKDSNDSVFHHDGSAAVGPIALCEVQGYAYAAKHGAAQLARALGLADRAEALERQAAELRVRFERAYWCEDLGTYALALDGDKRPCRVRTSNAGQCLFTGIASPEHARRLAQELLSPELFSGWGVRTLATSERAYNPMSYHNGSVWPHDNALVAQGLARYGQKEHAVRILQGLFDASAFVDLHRLPELFCGFPRRAGEGPTLYPVACAPQAWAAAAPLLLLESMLGLFIEADRQRVRLAYPVLPSFLDEVTISNLRVGSAVIDLRLQRYPEDVGIQVLRREGAVEVVTVK